MVKILGISGSPRKGSTEYSVLEALKAAAELPGVQTEYLSLRGKKINFCLHCDHCLRNAGRCVHKDDMAEIIDKLLSADGFIIGTPVYLSNMSGQLKTMFDRLRPLYMVNQGGLRNRVGGAIAVGGDRHGGQETAIQAILNVYLVYEVLAVGGVFPGGNFGGTVWSHDKGAEGARLDEEGLQTVRGLGRRVAQVALLLEKARGQSPQ